MRNKDLLNQLRRQREKLERLSGCSQSRKREREDEAEERREPGDLIRTLTDGDRGAGRAALAKPTVRFAGNETVLRNRVTFQSNEREDTSASDSHHHMQPLLGYDWIAGVLDAEDSLTERSDEFFNDLCTFRSLNKDECVHSLQAEVSIPRSALLPSYKYKAHRRSSFDPSDSLGLPSHCLSGWSNKGQSSLLPPSSLDLRSSLNTKNKELEVSKTFARISTGNFLAHSSRESTCGTNNTNKGYTYHLSLTSGLSLLWSRNNR
ncbi:Migration and invasion-inhibitory protein [Nibea albiflora]|uniref:Migration and invasion-inhibitory protein n=1 Tax=Nibea albiflora TaxID=240163 RepID=A0ACB7EZL2_NIBAL|nr:Migration and invasion-inhibitory protein [Nibea albiflora]